MKNHLSALFKALE